MKKYNTTQTTQNWIKVLTEIKKELDNSNVSALNSLFEERSISKAWVSFLRKNEIIYVNEHNNYKWNQKIPITTRLTESFREFQSVYSRSTVIKRRKINLSDYLQVNSDIVKMLNQNETFREIRKATGKSNTTISKVKLLMQDDTKEIKLISKKPNAIHKVKKVEFSDNPIKKVGLIRRFLRWIY
jgi:uncharacterized protein YerC